MFMLPRIRPVGHILGRRLQSSGSLFNELSPSSNSSGQPSEPASGETEDVYHSNRDLRQHPEIKKMFNPAPKIPVNELLSPLKKRLYELNLAQNNNRFVNNQEIKLDGKIYKLKLTRQEQIALEPSVYLQSYRIKGSWKKTYVWLRLFRRMALKDAISQCHFSSKRMAKDVGEMLERGISDAKKLGINPDDLIIDQIWVGKDGEDEKRMQCKGRGRSGIITSPFVHVKAVLKPKYIFEQRKEYIKDRTDRKVWFPLRDWKIKEDFVQTANYKW